MNVGEGVIDRDDSKLTGRKIVVPPESTAADRLSRFGVWILAAAFFAIPLTTLRPLTSATYGDLLFGLGLGVTVLLVIIRRRLPTVSLWIWVGGTVLLASVIVAELFPAPSVASLTDTFLNTPYGSSAATGVKLLVSLILLPLVIGTVVDRWSVVGLLVNAWLIGIAVSCAVAVIDAYGGIAIQTLLANDPSLVKTFMASEPSRYVGLAEHPNALSLTIVLAAPLAVAKMTDLRRVLIYYPLLLLMLSGVFLSGSRTGLIGLVLAALLTISLSPPVCRALCGNRRTLALLVTGIVVSVALLVMAPLNPSDETATQRSRDESTATATRLNPFESSVQLSNSEREKWLKDSISYISDRPLTGYGFQWIESSHNIYLQLPLSAGVLALIGYLIVMGGYLKEGWTVRVKLQSRGRKGDAVMLGTSTALTVSLIVYLVSGLASPEILDRYIYLPAGLIMAISALMVGDAISDATGQANES